MNGVRFIFGLVLLSLPLCGRAGVGSVDASFDAPAPNNWVRAIALQPDGKILIAGDFTTAGGSNSVRVARLLTNGHVDPTFINPNVGVNFVNSIAVQADGKILIAGDFTAVSGIARAKFARLNSDGTLDTGYAAAQPAAVSGEGKQIIALSDGRALLVGPTQLFSISPFIIRNNAIMLTTNGIADASFPNVPILSAGTFCAVERPGGKILIGGLFTSTAGNPRTNLMQLDSLGAPDNTFVQSPAADLGWARTLQPMADGRIVVVTTGAGTNYVRRINSDGTADGTFGTPYSDASILTAAVQTDGKIWIAGDFLWINDVQRLKVARLNSDGSLDSSFGTGNTGTGTSVFALTMQPDGKLLMGGAFNCYNNNCLGTVVRLLGDLTANNPTLVGTTFNVSVPTVTGKTYSLQYKLLISDTNWISIPPPVAGNGTSQVLTDPNATNSQSIYRIVEY